LLRLLDELSYLTSGVAQCLFVFGVLAPCQRVVVGTPRQVAEFAVFVGAADRAGDGDACDGGLPAKMFRPSA
jgi:hypothetical protein